MLTKTSNQVRKVLDEERGDTKPTQRKGKAPVPSVDDVPAKEKLTEDGGVMRNLLGHRPQQRKTAKQNKLDPKQLVDDNSNYLKIGGQTRSFGGFLQGMVKEMEALLSSQPQRDPILPIGGGPGRSHRFRLMRPL